MVQVSATVVEMDGVIVLRLDGDLTAATVLGIQSDFAPLFRRPSPIIVVDLSRVTACDSTGALSLDVAGGVAADCGGELRLVVSPGAVCRLLRDSGTMRAVRSFATLEGAVRADPLDLLDSVPEPRPARHPR
jgi:anti-anti-sigma factor